MSTPAIRAALDLLVDAEPDRAPAADCELLADLQTAAELARVVERRIVAMVADLERRGVSTPAATAASSAPSAT